MYRALDTLKEVGLLIPVTDLETYHGRVGTADEVAEWMVDPAFANGGNDSGNGNVNKRATLYTGGREVAEDFTVVRRQEMTRPKYNKIFEDKIAHYTPQERQEWLDREIERHQGLFGGRSTPPKTVDDLRAWPEVRRLQNEVAKDEQKVLWDSAAEGLRPEVHEIVTADTDATVIDLSFDETKLDTDARAKYQKALDVLVLPVTAGSPVNFNDRNKVLPFMNAIRQAKKTGYITSSEVPELAADAKIDERAALQLASSLNTRRIAQIKPSYLVSELLNHSTDIFTANLEIDKEKQDLPINLEYVQRYLHQTHIVGVKQSISSMTLGRDTSSVSFFDLEKTTTSKGLEAERKDTWQRLGAMATALSQSNVGEVQPKQALLHLLSDVHAKPEKLVATAKEVEGYDAIFEGDAGNWEGYTLAEHTETVLRNFDESFAEKLPVELLAPMRLAILSHDLGKPEAAEEGEKHKQMEYNLKQADDFLGKLGVENKLKDLLLAVIGEGEELAFQIEINGAGEPAKAAMKRLATKTLKQFYDSETVTDEQITGFSEMCKMLQVCDGGAYTSMAITNRGRGKGHYRNAASFNSNFVQPLDFGKRVVRLRKEGEKAAEPDLSPNVPGVSSRVRISLNGAGRKPPKVTT
jgi:hypothetical protein